MDKIKKILTDPQLAHYWQELYQEMMGEIPTKYDVTQMLKGIGIEENIVTEYGDTYYLMIVINYVADNIEGLNFEWTNKDTLEMKECGKGEIIDAKEGIMFNLNKLLDYGAIDLNTAEDIKAKLDLPDIEDEDDDDFYFDDEEEEEEDDDDDEIVIRAD